MKNRSDAEEESDAAYLSPGYASGNLTRYLNTYFDIKNEDSLTSDAINKIIFFNEWQIQKKSKDKNIFSSDAKNYPANAFTAHKTIYEYPGIFPKKKFIWPDEKPFALCITHDVDEIYPPTTHILNSIPYFLKNQDSDFLYNAIRCKMGKRKQSPYMNFNAIMKLEQGYGATSSFYFLATEEDIRRFRLSVEDLGDTIGTMVDLGFEVGLHGGYYSFDDKQRIKNEKERLEKVVGKKIIGYRNHYLQLKIPDTWEYLQDMGFKYDSTYGFNDLMGFRNGICHPFHPFNLVTDKTMEILELPMIIMDGSIEQSNKTEKQTWDNIKMIIDSAARSHGVVTIDWHSNSFNCPFKLAWEKMYSKILAYCYEKNGWITSGENIVNWWEKNNG